MSTSKLVASVMGHSVSSMERIARQLPEGADIVELRLDGLTDPDAADLATLARALTRPAIVTCRAKTEGGSFAGTDSERLSLLERAAAMGFDYVDVELAALERPFSKGDAKLILSHHDFTGLPRDGARLMDEALALDADVVKLAARVSSLDEAWSLAAMGDAVKKAGKAFAPVAMGPAGVAARILAARFDAAFTYAAARGGVRTGPGQVLLDDMLGLYRFHTIDADTEVYGILGAHALASRSPAMHNPFFAGGGRNAVYVPFEASDLEAFLRGAKRLAVSGLSVTLPYKEAILPLLDEVDALAERIGAVNTVVVERGRWKGYNTDIDGVAEPLRRLGDWSGRSAVVVGSGGAARGAVFALEGLGASVTVLARRQDKAAALAGAIGAASGELAELDGARFDVLVNATPVGSDGASDTELPVASLDASQCVFDMVTAPEVTPLIRRARGAGARTVTGIQMLAAQAVRQDELWTGERPPVEELEQRARGDVGRYSRQVLFEDIGADGQRRIRNARVLVVGVGALGSVSSEMIARAGVATLRIVDRDYVDESNLQRQSLFDEDDWREGLPKAIAAERKLSRINGDVSIEAHVSDVHAGNVRGLFRGVDLVIDGTDNFETRYLLNDASVDTGVPWIYAACVGSYGMSFAVIPGRTPCMRCFLEDEPAPGTSPTCDTAGVITPIVHAVAGFQVAEALKFLAGRDDALTGDVFSLDVWRGRVDRFRPSEPRGECPACGRRELDYLAGDGASQAVTLCGRNAVQVRPAKARALALDDVARRLAKLGSVRVNDYLVRAELDGRELVLFKDGRAIVHGTEDPAEARSLYARYVGN